MSEIVQRTARLRAQINSLCRIPHPLTSRPPVRTDLIVTHCEINPRHGTGVLLERLFAGNTRLLTIRSRDLYDGKQTFGTKNIRLSHDGRSRPEILAAVLAAMGNNLPARVLCVPYFPDDVLTALAINDIYNAPLCTYVMDDQNVCVEGIPDALMAELLSRSTLRLAISPELQSAYEQKYGHQFWFLPPLVPTALLLRSPLLEAPMYPSDLGVVIGNIWGQEWLERLRSTVRNSGLRLRWYCSSGSWRSFLNFKPEALLADDIELHEPIAHEVDLVAEVRKYAFAIVPSGTLDSADNRNSLAHLSLPSRIPFILATCGTPLIVLGSAETAAARFVRRFQVGTACPYDAAAFRQTVAAISTPACQTALRSRAAALAPLFDDRGGAEWIWRSLELRRPCTLQYERLNESLTTMADPAPAVVGAHQL
jgi:hypothetical protein